MRYLAIAAALVAPAAVCEGGSADTSPSHGLEFGEDRKVRYVALKLDLRIQEGLGFLQ